MKAIFLTLALLVAGCTGPPLTESGQYTVGKNLTQEEWEALRDKGEATGQWFSIDAELEPRSWEFDIAGESVLVSRISTMHHPTAGTLQVMALAGEPGDRGLFAADVEMAGVADWRQQLPGADPACLAPCASTILEAKLAVDEASHAWLDFPLQPTKQWQSTQWELSSISNYEETLTGEVLNLTTMQVGGEDVEVVAISYTWTTKHTATPLLDDFEPTIGYYAPSLGHFVKLHVPDWAAHPHIFGMAPVPVPGMAFDVELVSTQALTGHELPAIRQEVNEHYLRQRLASESFEIELSTPKQLTMTGATVVPETGILWTEFRSPYALGHDLSFTLRGPQNFTYPVTGLRQEVLQEFSVPGSYDVTAESQLYGRTVTKATANINVTHAELYQRTCPAVAANQSELLCPATEILAWPGTTVSINYARNGTSPGDSQFRVMDGSANTIHIIPSSQVGGSTTFIAPASATYPGWTIQYEPSIAVTESYQLAVNTW